MSAPPSAAGFGEEPLGTPLTLFLIQLILVVAVCRGLAFLFKYIKRTLCPVASLCRATRYC